MPENKSQYNKQLKPLARELRNDSTLGEIVLWSKVLKSNGTGYQFNRQFAMKLDELNIIVDFICRSLKLIIEIDGYSHNFKYKEDVLRDRKLNEYGYTVLRFTEQEVLHDIDNVVIAIENMISQLSEK